MATKYKIELNVYSESGRHLGFRAIGITDLYEKLGYDELSAMSYEITKALRQIISVRNPSIVPDARKDERSPSNADDEGSSPSRGTKFVEHRGHRFYEQWCDECDEYHL